MDKNLMAYLTVYRQAMAQDRKEQEERPSRRPFQESLMQKMARTPPAKEEQRA